MKPELSMEELQSLAAQAGFRIGSYHSMAGDIQFIQPVMPGQCSIDVELRNFYNLIMERNNGSNASNS